MFASPTLRLAAVFGVGMLLLPAVWPAAAQPTRASSAADTFLEELQVNVVNVEVYVTDKRGVPVTDLTIKDFEVREDGKKVELSNFALIEDSETTAPGAPAAGDPDLPPQYVMLFFDNVTIDPTHRKRALEELRGFVHRDRGGNVAYAVAAYDGSLSVLQPFTYDSEAVLAALRRLGGLSSLGVLRRQQHLAALREGLELLGSIRQLEGGEVRGTETSRYYADYTGQIDRYAERLRQLNGASFYAMSHLSNALAALPGRKVVIYVSEGLPARPGEELYHAVAETLGSVQGGVQDPDTARGGMSEAALRSRSGALSALDSRGRGSRRKGDDGPNEDLTMLTALANAGNVSFYAYKALGSLGGVAPELDGATAALYTPQLASIRESNLAETLRVLADETGGKAVVGGEMEALMAQARTDAAGYYSLGYSPNHVGDGRFHDVKVKVKGRGLEVRYRTGYVDKPLAVKVADRTSTALLLGVDDNPLGLDLAIGAGRPATEGDYWVVPVTFSVPLAAVTLLPEGDVYALEAQLYIAARSEVGDMAPVQEATLRLEVPTAELERAKAEVHTTQFELALRQGRQRLAIGFVDPIAAVTSFVSRDIDVGEP